MPEVIASMLPPETQNYLDVLFLVLIMPFQLKVGVEQNFASWQKKRILLSLLNNFNADLSLQQKRDNFITEFRDPKIHACSTESHFKKI